jgi:poly-gamma-glutamate capsule biosynthesis protein CapA/YwtB (metallophosphatase superfamily)
VNLQHQVKNSARPDLLTLAAWSRFKGLQRWAARKFPTHAKSFDVPADATRIVLTGDINFDSTIRMMWNLGLHRIRARNGHGSLAAKVKRRFWRKFVEPMLSPDFSAIEAETVFDEFSIEKPKAENEIVEDDFVSRTQPAEVDWSKAATDWDFPFRKISPFLQAKDLVVVNLETPLTNHRRDNGLFKSNPNYASAMKRAGVSVANLSNNHIFDAGEKGFNDTLDHLGAAGIECIGVGHDLENARAGKVFQIKGARFSFLAYTQFCNSRFTSLAGTEPGLLPLDRKLMTEDIGRARKNADIVIVSLHWGLENQPGIHPNQTQIARGLIDAGADAIIGHHPHVPHAIEVYRGCPIFYSLGNFIFGQSNHSSWSDNFICELVLSGKEWIGAVIHPISGRGSGLFQPEILDESAAVAVLEDLRLKSLVFRTDLAIDRGVGYLALGRKGAPYAA